MSKDPRPLSEQDQVNGLHFHIVMSHLLKLLTAYLREKCVEGVVVYAEDGLAVKIRWIGGPMYDRVVLPEIDRLSRKYNCTVHSRGPTSLILQGAQVYLDISSKFTKTV